MTTQTTPVKATPVVNSTGVHPGNATHSPPKPGGGTLKVGERFTGYASKPAPVRPAATPARPASTATTDALSEKIDALTALVKSNHADQTAHMLRIENAITLRAAEKPSTSVAK
jgi:hypothetical protein